MTKLEALSLSLKIWTWLADHPGQEKKHAFEALGLDPNMAAKCPACQYVLEQTGDYGSTESCPLCPMWHVPYERPCYRNEFQGWDSAIDYNDNNVAKRYAQAIADRAARKLAELDPTGPYPWAAEDGLYEEEC